MVTVSSSTVGGVAQDPRPWLVRSAMVLFILGVCALAVDFGVWGPTREWMWQTQVVRPTEQTWGFHAEWRAVEGRGQRLVVLEVTPGGPFEAAGIEPGTVIYGGECAWYEWRGGFYGVLSESGDEALVTTLQTRDGRPQKVVVRVERRQAT